MIKGKDGEYIITLEDNIKNPSVTLEVNLYCRKCGYVPEHRISQSFDLPYDYNCDGERSVVIGEEEITFGDDPDDICPKCGDAMEIAYPPDVVLACGCSEYFGAPTYVNGKSVRNTRIVCNKCGERFRQRELLDGESISYADLYNGCGCEILTKQDGTEIHKPVSQDSDCPQAI